MTDLKQKVDQAVAVIQKRTRTRPDVAIILGTGLGSLTATIEIEAEVPFEEIPHFARPTAMTHEGRLVMGRFNGHAVAALQGRFHYYEGYSLEQITFPVRVMRSLGAKALFLTGLAGGLNPVYARGDIVLIDDHINLMWVNPLVGPNDDSLGPRFPDMAAPYDLELISAAEAGARELGIKVHRGVYAAMTGPCLETRAEYRMLQRIGADVVGMSTVPEVIVGVHAGLRVLAVAVVTDMCLPDTLVPVNVPEIIAIANGVEPRLTGLLRHVLASVKP